MLKELGRFQSKDGTIKTVFENNNDIVEVSLLRNKKYDVIVVPSHHYCNLSCKMCHLTNCKIDKPMTPITKEELLEAIKHSVTYKGYKLTDKKNLLISFMGVGEPLLNFELIKSIYQDENLIKELGYENISYALSTMMPINNMERITNEVNELNIPLKIHFSLHSSHDYIRKQIIPSSKVTIDEALYELFKYRNIISNNEEIMSKYKLFHRTTDPVEIHYTLIKDQNDSAFELANLIYVLDKYKIPIKFLRFNPKEDLKASSRQQVWIDTIKEYIPDLRVKTYAPPGKDIGSSCGEFTKHFYLSDVETEEEKREYESWYKLHLIKD